MFIALTSIGTLPAACAASVWNSAPCARTIAPISAIGCIVADLVVRRHHADQHRARRQRRAQRVEIDQAVAADAEHGDVAALLLEARQASSTDLCSVATVMT